MNSGPSSRHSADATALPLARQQVTDLAVQQVDQLHDTLGISLSAVSAIGDRAHDTKYSATVRALGLEFLPKAYYVDYCVAALRHALVEPGVDLNDVAVRLNEVEALLGRIMDITATRDLSGHLDVPLELVSKAQSGAFAALAQTKDIRSLLTSSDPAALQATLGVEDESPVLIGRTAGWLTSIAVRLLPASSRHRYYEEFISELHSMAAEGASCRAQFFHAGRLVITIWALRRTLPRSSMLLHDEQRTRRLVKPLQYTIYRPPLGRQRAVLLRWNSRRKVRNYQRVQIKARNAQGTYEGGVGHGPND